MRTKEDVPLGPWKQRDSPTLSYEINDGDGNDKDITGWEVHFEIKKNRDVDDKNGEVVKDNAGNGGASITNAGNGEAEIDIQTSDIENLEGEYYWSAWVVKASGDTQTTHEGEVKIRES